MNLGASVENDHLSVAVLEYGYLSGCIHITFRQQLSPLRKDKPLSTGMPTHTGAYR